MHLFRVIHPVFVLYSIYIFIYKFFCDRRVGNLSRWILCHRRRTTGKLGCHLLASFRCPQLKRLPCYCYHPQTLYSVLPSVWYTRMRENIREARGVPWRTELLTTEEVDFTRFPLSGICLLDNHRSKVLICLSFPSSALYVPLFRDHVIQRPSLSLRK